MSGIEVAGLVLGSIPLIVKAVEAYMGFMKEWKKAISELKNINTELSTERSRLYNVCDKLLEGIVPESDMEAMLQDPFGPLWHIKDTNAKIRTRLWNSYVNFETIVMEVKEALDDIMQRLRIEITADGQVEWVTKGRMTRDFKKLLFRLKWRDYQTSLATITRGVDGLEGLAGQSVALEPARKKRSGGRVLKVLRDLSASIYRALCSSILCTDTHQHHVSLELSARRIDVGFEDADEKVLHEVHFKLAISFDKTVGPTKKRFWDEIQIKTERTSAANTVAKQNNISNNNNQAVTSPTKAKKVKGVSFSLTQTFSFMSSSSGKPPSADVKSAMAALTRHATDIAFIDTPTNPVGPPVNLCTALPSAHQARPVCYGHLIDKQCLDRCFKVYPLGTATNSDTWTLVTLKEVLESKRGLQPLVSLKDKVRLAFSISSSVVQLSKTPWLPGELTSANVHFFQRGDQLSYQHPFLLRSIPDLQTTITNSHTHPDKMGGVVMMNKNTTLFALGILLLEIILGSSLDKLRGPAEAAMAIPGDELGIIRDSVTVHRLLERRVALINPAYKAVIERCMECTASQGLDEENFRQEVYNGVVLELESILESTKLGA